MLQLLVAIKLINFFSNTKSIPKIRQFDFRAKHTYEDGLKCGFLRPFIDINYADVNEFELYTVVGAKNAATGSYLKLICLLKSMNMHKANL